MSTPTNPIRALLVIDMQNDFLPGGSLATKTGDKLVPRVNTLRRKFEGELVVFSQDWHPENHVSFAKNNKDSKPFTTITLPNGQKQEMWPDHCVQHSEGAKLHHDLVIQDEDEIVWKGADKDVDSYSAFADNTGTKPTRLEGLLKSRGVTDVYVCGVATDFCVKFTCEDAVKRGLKTYLVEDVIEGIDPQGTANARQSLQEKGVISISSASVHENTNPVPPPITARALLVVNVQTDFLAGGASAIKGGDELIPKINKLRETFDGELVVFTQQINAPPAGTKLPKDLTTHEGDAFITISAKNVTSAFVVVEANSEKKTQLEATLKKHNVTDLYVCGLATDGSVKFTCLDARKLKFNTHLVTDAIVGSDEASTQKAIAELRAAGVVETTSGKIKANPSTVEYMTDVEGHWDYFKTLVLHSHILEFEMIGKNQKSLDVAEPVADFQLRFKPGKENETFVFGGDVCDKGTSVGGSLRVVELLTHFKKRHPDNVILVLGNRDINKMRWTSECNEDLLKQLFDSGKKGVESHNPSYWIPEKEFLKNWPGINEIDDKAAKESGKFTVDHLKILIIKWMLDKTLGSAGEFERRQQEMSVVYPQYFAGVKGTDEQIAHAKEVIVANSFLTGRFAENMNDYIRKGQIAYIHHPSQSLFIHGAIHDNFYGYVPGDLNGKTTWERENVDAQVWVDRLNHWATSQTSAWAENGKWLKDVNYAKRPKNNPRPDAGFTDEENKKILVNISDDRTAEVLAKFDGPEADWSHRNGDRLLDFVLPKAPASCVTQTNFDWNANLNLNNLERLAPKLRYKRDGRTFRILHIFTGHVPNASSPAIGRVSLNGDRELGFFGCDTSYAKYGYPDNRGFETKKDHHIIDGPWSVVYADKRGVHVEGKGSNFNYGTSEETSAYNLNFSVGPTGSRCVGKPVTGYEGFLVRAKTTDGKYVLVKGLAQGRSLEYKFIPVSEGDLALMLASTKQMVSEVKKMVAQPLY